MNSISRIVASLVFLVASVGAQLCFAANVIYTYTGNNFTNIIDNPSVPGSFDTSMRVSGTFELSSALPPNRSLSDFVIPLSFSFGNGRSIITNTSPGLSRQEFRIATDATGNITQWQLSLIAQPGIADFTIQTRSDQPNTLPFDQGNYRLDVSTTNEDYAYNTSVPGSWTTTGAPPPSGNAWHWPIQNDSRANITQDFAEYQSIKSTQNPSGFSNHHTGFDIHADVGTPVVAADEGVVVQLQQNRVADNTKGSPTKCKSPTKVAESGNCGDHGDGNTIVLRHSVGGPNSSTYIYSQYQHLRDGVDTTTKRPLAFEPTLWDSIVKLCGGGTWVGGVIECPQDNAPVVHAGQVIAFSGSSGTLASDPAPSNSNYPPHLHFEIKKFKEFASVNTVNQKFEYGYTRDRPTVRGYIDPSSLLEKTTAIPHRLIVKASATKRFGPRTDYPNGTTSSNERFIAVQEATQPNAGCSFGWYQIVPLEMDVSRSRPPDAAYFQKGEVSQTGLNPDAWVCKGDVSLGELVTVVHVGDVVAPFNGGVDQADVCAVKAAMVRRGVGQNDVFDLNGDRRVNAQDAKLAERLCSPACLLSNCP